ncbi:hypothetical protein [Rhizobium indicum]|uniref:Uncharacterized protein n=1 Tax=Rhizobium indicum TaxID=2583231 RepID=A0ABX6P9Y1_9HYPH|nr:hypothetical protein [Rhizobium indicum]QKK15421.1 hypothetical protein FFM53_003035 [Rhizobium indicum]
MKLVSLAVVTAFVAFPISVADAQQSQGIYQYKAAMSRLFLGGYRAMPVYRANPVWPGDVIQMDNESIIVTDCFAGQKGGNYIEIRNAGDTVTVGTGVDVDLAGSALSARLAALKASGHVQISDEIKISATPLSHDPIEGGESALLKWNRAKSNCAIIEDLYHGRQSKYLLVGEVLHGKVRFEITGHVDAGGNLQAKARLEGIIPVELNVSTKVSLDSLMVTTSKDEMTLAVIPAHYNASEVARITEYLRGERGAQLEIAVQQALRARDIGEWNKISIFLYTYLGTEVARRNDWVERLIAGSDMIPTEKLTNDDFKAVSLYGAAMNIAQGAPM